MAKNHPLVDNYAFQAGSNPAGRRDLGKKYFSKAAARRAAGPDCTRQAGEGFVRKQEEHNPTAVCLLQRRPYSQDLTEQGSSNQKKGHSRFLSLASEKKGPSTTDFMSLEIFLCFAKASTRKTHAGGRLRRQAINRQPILATGQRRYRVGGQNPNGEKANHWGQKPWHWLKKWE